MGVSDGAYFAWLGAALERFERATGELGAVGELRAAATPSAVVDGPTAAPRTPVDFCVLAGARMNPALELARDALGRERTRVTFLDKFATGPDVIPADFNRLGDVASDSADVIVMTRASYMIEDSAAFLAGARRILRPGGLLIIDWLHGAADAPLLTLPGHHEYAGRAYPFHTTYCDAEFVGEFPDEFAAFIAHVNRPPAWVDLDRPGARVPARAWLRRVLGRGPRRDVTPATYLATLRADLARAGKHLIEPDQLSPAFKVVFRDARYLYPRTRKFHLHLLTVLRPTGA